MRLYSTRSPSALLNAPETVHAPLLARFAETVAECGGEPLALLHGVGIDTNRGADTPLSYRKIAALFELSASKLKRPDFGLLLARRQCEDNLTGPLGTVMQHAENFGTALEIAVRHSYAH